MAEDANSKKVFITKFVLTRGKIIEVNIKKSNKYEFWIDADKTSGHVYRPGDFFETIEEAKVNAEQRRLKEIARLKKHMDKLEKLSFN